ncbi:GNAT superfamily N-acetyltransferase [Caulobacter ginsengisoli]|uniref:GNAT superfamily N-acetyltransferase n=1 Tax=Caulobacter ginsengisoli TaxID=400775 RepID=A0ABU0IRV6_9CAUL|nr:GNAT family N-acetyltransferase [Caulobacter ginsengisoli]MDQ0464145.1 GNAT superfamily N-acetyltransferase [Caulobacter ginsengisoli]
MTVRLRPYHAEDLGALYAISLATGDSGQDAGSLHADRRMIGHIYSAPYAILSPETALVAEDEQGVGGYIVGVADTRAFEARLEQDWWPDLRRRYADPQGSPPESWTADQRRAWLIHHPFATPDYVVGAFPGHLHMNLLPRLQGRGVGTALLNRWLAEIDPSGGLHVGVSRDNLAGLAFWRARGFEPIARPAGARAGGAHWLGLARD